MKIKTLSLLMLSSVTSVGAYAQQSEVVVNIDDADSWRQVTGATSNASISEDGLVTPNNASNDYTFTSSMLEFSTLTNAQDIVFKQSDVWDNWIPVANVGPSGARDAPVLLSVKDGEYYFLASINGDTAYQAWSSSNMVNWEFHGRVTGPDHTTGRWTTTAEYKDGQFYIYYDSTNDENPALYIDNDLTDGVPGTNFGVVYADPTPGSDISVFRDDADGRFHIIYEDWSPIQANVNSWDSPLAGHVSSPDGINGFRFGDHPSVVDHRTTPTGRFGSYQHPQQGTLTYEIHEPAQDAYGDWTTVKVGSQYYLFSDFHPVNRSIRLGRFTSSSLEDEEFELIGELGNGHPDPSVAFAEGQFYLVTQQTTDYVSPGPWVNGVSARVGVDTDGNGTIDQRTGWQTVQERYDHKAGYARVVDVEDARLNLASLPSGFGFQFEFRVDNSVVANVSPLMDSVTMKFSGSAATGNNLARNKSVTQSSTAFSGAASRAVDGNTNGVYSAGAGSVTHTEPNSQNPWWRVDLGSSVNIGQINIFNRTDSCCSNRLDGATVYVGNINSTDPSLYTAVGTLSGSSIQTLAGVNTAGRYVMVRIAGQGTLSLAEVQVFEAQGGTTPPPPSLDNVALNQAATQSSTAWSGAASRAVDGNTNGVYDVASGSVTHTQPNSQNPWWRVDLGATYNVEQINVFNRTDNGFNSRLNGATVYVGNVNSSSPADYTAVGTLNGSASVQSFAGVNTTGRYVMVRIAGQGTLSLAEVQVFAAEQTGGAFVPDPNKLYHIDNPAHGLRLAASANSEVLGSRTFSSSGVDTQWRFVQSATSGLWHIQRAAGGSTPRIRTVLTTIPDMQATNSSGTWTRFSITPNSNRPGTYLLTVPLANTLNQRLRLLSNGTTDFAGNTNLGDNPSFVITEVR